MKTIEKIVIGTLIGAGFFGGGVLAQQCSHQVLEIIYNLPQKNIFNEYKNTLSEYKDALNKHFYFLAGIPEKDVNPENNKNAFIRSYP